MRQMSFEAKNKNTSMSDYPKLKLAKDERARILCPEEPAFAFVHTLRAPTIVNGQPKYVPVETKSGESREVLKMDFIGRPLCLGDEGILEDKGTDPKNCPVCALASTSDMASPPERRFAMHVVRYTLKSTGGGFDLASPFSCQLMVWAFPDSIFNKLVDFVAEWGSLQNHDLLLGPCLSGDFQKFDIAISAKAAWQDSEEQKANVLQTFRENKAPNLEAFCGRKVERSWMIEDLEKVQARWRIVNGQPEQDATQSAESLTEGLDALLKDHPGGLDEFAPSPPRTEDFSTLLTGGQDAASTATDPAGAGFAAVQDATAGVPSTELAPSAPSAAPGAASASPAPASPSPAIAAAPLSFDDLLNQLDA
jgi:hypothetical protein